MRARGCSEDGQATVVLVGLLVAVLLGALLLGGLGAALAQRSDRQRAMDLAALAGARAMREAYPRLFEPPEVGGAANPRWLSHPRYLELGRAAARATARRNGVADVEVDLPSEDGLPPLRIDVRDARPIEVGRFDVPVTVRAQAELVPDAGAGMAPLLSGNPGEYRGPFATRQGKPMRPDVALAFDRMAAAARADGVTLLITSAFRSDAEQAVLWARHPDPKWVARPGTSLHRLGTELDLGPRAAYGWLAANAKRFGFLQRYGWEPWHFGFVRNPGSVSVGAVPEVRAAERGGDDGAGGGGEGGGPGSGLPSWVPARFRATIARAAMRWSISAALLAAQLRQESGFDPDARSGAGAMGIAQFMPGTARSLGLRDPFDPEQAIDAQAHLMRDLLRQFGSVPLALAAYNAGPGAVQRFGGIPPFRETQDYVVRILGLLHGAGDLLVPAAGLEVRLVA
ncbi:lytic transglycosylase domain-containing protein [Conexibacter sp. SYSU D00693]|uniref:lytic transglycosylase domain-containing protein n=1 Tax=Conexibacter sp. SYSU D00693 TaxID=2812560 RepID=UPI00196B50E1|nr:transglycosylase SLT domain-containing protein [Conexibacter sp. SYSU D00693]